MGRETLLGERKRRRKKEGRGRNTRAFFHYLLFPPRNPCRKRKPHERKEKKKKNAGSKSRASDPRDHSAVKIERRTNTGAGKKKNIVGTKKIFLSCEHLSFEERQK